MAEQFAIALPQPVNRHAQGALLHAQRPGNVRLRSAVFACREKNFQLPKQLCLAVRFTFLLQPFDDLCEQRQGPFAIKRLVGTGSAVAAT